MNRKKYFLFIFISVLVFSLYPQKKSNFLFRKNQPIQIKSKVIYKNDLKDAFFKSEEWTYPWYIIFDDEGRFEDTTGRITKKKDIPKLRCTAKCYTEHQGKHQIKFSKARLYPDGTLEILIHDFTASTNDNLNIVIKNGKYCCQYWTTYVGDSGDEGLIWTTKKQKLILNKKEYKIGEMVKGKIEFECVQEITNPKYGKRFRRTIKIKGVFKPTLKSIE